MCVCVCVCQLRLPVRLSVTDSVFFFITVFVCLSVCLLVRLSVYCNPSSLRIPISSLTCSLSLILSVVCAIAPDVSLVTTEINSDTSRFAAAKAADDYTKRDIKTRGDEKKRTNYSHPGTSIDSYLFSRSVEPSRPPATFTVKANTAAIQRMSKLLANIENCEIPDRISHGY